MHQTLDQSIAGSSPVAYYAGSNPVMAKHFVRVMAMVAWSFCQSPTDFFKKMDNICKINPKMRNAKLRGYVFDSQLRIMSNLAKTTFQQKKLSQLTLAFYRKL